MKKYKIEDLVTYDVYEKLGKEYHYLNRIIICKPQHISRRFVTAIDGTTYYAHLEYYTEAGDCAAVHPISLLARFDRDKIHKLVQNSTVLTKKEVLELQIDLNDEIKKSTNVGDNTL